MNPSGGGCNNPPPPGTEVCAEFEEDENGKRLVEEEIRKVMLEYEGESSTSSKVKGESGEETKNKIDRIDPFLKNPEYLEYERRRHSRESSRHRRRSHSRPRHTDRRKGRHRSRSRSRDRHRRSRSRRHRRHRSSSRKSKREKRHKQSSSSRSRRYSRSRSRSRRHHIKAHRGDTKSDSERDDPANTSGEVEEEDEPATKENAFKNDGSFLEMFKKMQEEQEQKAAKEQAAGSSDSAAMIPPIAKRRGGRILKTGLVEKAKVIDEFMQGDGLDAWSVYMKEVKRYKEACCDDDSKTRPLVK